MTVETKLATHGGSRPGAGRPKEIARAAAQLERVRDKLHAEFYISAGELAQAMPQLTRLAIKAATGSTWTDADGKEHREAPDRGMLRFLLEQFWRIVGSMPGEESAKAKETRAQFLAIINNYTSERPEAVEANGRPRVIEAEVISDTRDVGGVFQPK